MAFSAHLQPVVKMISETKLIKEGGINLYSFSEPYMQKLLISVFNDTAESNGNIKIKDKGEISCALSRFFKQKSFLTTDLVSEDEKKLRSLSLKNIDLQRTIISRNVPSLPVVCMVRGYYTQSFGSAYEKGKSWTQGLPIEEDVLINGKFETPFFNLKIKNTPCHEDGAIEYLSAYLEKNKIEDLSSKVLCLMLKQSAISVYNEVSAFSQIRGLSVIDTRLKFGLERNIEDKWELVWTGEGITPNTTRFLDGNNVLNEDLLKKNKGKIDEDVVKRVANNYQIIAERLLA
ncbi:MAG: phosphoribosylaminoimidazolesuccinocarboxamide synthase [Candidatus Pacebacteria bacterium]|nr:phosphoribosylaminoimidazolesuccinocarboxamide synthase [Candidatus Paceibacterota bacterium]